MPEKTLTHKLGSADMRDGCLYFPDARLEEYQRFFPRRPFSIRFGKETIASSVESRQHYLTLDKSQLQRFFKAGDVLFLTTDGNQLSIQLDGTKGKEKSLTHKLGTVDLRQGYLYFPDTRLEEYQRFFPRGPISVSFGKETIASSVEARQHYLPLDKVSLRRLFKPGDTLILKKNGKEVSIQLDGATGKELKPSKAKRSTLSVGRAKSRVSEGGRGRVEGKDSLTKVSVKVETPVSTPKQVSMPEMKGEASAEEPTPPRNPATDNLTTHLTLLPSFDDLDLSQLGFCEAPIGNIRLLAPAGCGKTLCLLYRCLRLSSISDSRKPRFLIVTFTNAAAGEIADRLAVDDRFASVRNQITVCTLNAWGWKKVRGQSGSPQLVWKDYEKKRLILKQLKPVWRNHEKLKEALERKKTNYRPLIRVMDDLKSLAFDHVDHEDVDSFLGHVRSLVDQRLGWKLKRIIEEIRRLEIIQTGSQNDMVDGDSSLLDEYRIMFNEFFGFWRQAVVNLSEQDEFTFEDQKYFAHRHLLERTRKSHERVDHVIVDEFQDINPLDLKLLRTIGDHYEATITIVGDDDQAIYEWRGSTPEYILDPEKYFSRNFQTYTLSTNYRSPKNIVLDSQRLIKHNRRRVNKEIIPNLSETADYIIQTPPDIKSALDLVNRFVEETVRDKFNPGTIGMIYRKRSQMIPYQVRFATSHIRYSADRDLHLFLSKAFDSLLVMLQIKQRIADGYTPSAVVPDFLCLCDQIRDYQLIKEERRNLENHLQEANPATLDSACQALLNFRQPLFKTKNDYGEASSKCDTIIRDFIRSRSVSEALAVLGDKFRGFQKNFMKSEEDIWYRDPPFTQLAEFAESYRDDYGAFISDIQLAKKHLEENPPYNDDDDSQSGLQHAKTSPLLLLTAHRAKGREFDTVIIVDANEEIWPGKKVETDDQHEEARRLFYVAFTRARKRLLILVSKTIGSEVARPSRYLKELGLEGF